MGPRSAKVQAFILYIPFLVFPLMTLMMTFIHMPAFILSLVGIIAIIWAKVSLKERTRVLFEFGTKNMTKKEKIIYLSGYALLIVSLILIANHI